MKDTLIEIRNDLQGNNSRVDEAENQINDLEHKQKTTTQNNKKKKASKKNKDSKCSLWVNFKKSNICIIGEGGGEKEKRKGKKLKTYLKK